MSFRVAQVLEFQATGDQAVRIGTARLFWHIPEGRSPDEDDRRHLLRNHVRYQPEVLQGVGPQQVRIIDDDRTPLAVVSADGQCVEHSLHIIRLKLLLPACAEAGR